MQRKIDKFERGLRVYLGRVRAAAHAIAAVKTGDVLSPETIKLIEGEFITGIEELSLLLDHARRSGTLSRETVDELKGRFLRQN
jgi:hypothetical protein